MKRTAVLFDMDGLMVDTEPLAREAWAQVAGGYGATITDDLFGRMLGRRTVESAQLVLAELQLPISVDELVSRKTGAYLATLEAGVPVMPGLWELLDAIERRGLPWAVATSTPRPVAQVVLDRLGVTGRFRALACGDEVTHGKPAPDIFLLAAARLDVPPAVCLALEDSRPGCAAAVAAGMRVIAVPGEYSRGEAFADAYRCFHSLAEVTSALDDLLTG